MKAARSMKEKVTGTKMGAPSTHGNDGPHQVGGRYAVEKLAPLFSVPSLEGKPVAQLVHKEPVTLLCICSGSGFVAQKGSKVYGWLDLRSRALSLKRLAGSWEARAQYMVQSPAVLREEEFLSSPKVGEVVPGDEVLVLEMGFNEDEPGELPRLRLMVSVSTAGKEDKVGWMSPETEDGELLLHPVNLLSSQVADIIGSTGKGSSAAPDALGASSYALGASSYALGASSWVLGKTHRKDKRERTTKEDVVLTAPQYSYQPGSALPWVVDAQYRTLAKVAMRKDKELSSSEIAEIPAGTLVTVQEITRVKCEALRLCPVALVSVDEGAQEKRTGWVRCAGTNGRDVIDIRNQHEANLVLAQWSETSRTRVGSGFSAGDVSMAIARVRMGKTLLPTGEDSQCTVFTKAPTVVEAVEAKQEEVQEEAPLVDKDKDKDKVSKEGEKRQAAVAKRPQAGALPGCADFICTFMGSPPSKARGA